MVKKSKPNTGFEELHEVKTAGFTATKNIKRDKSFNRRAGLHDKLKNLQGESRVKRRKPLGLKHVRRMRKFAAVASVGVVGAIAVVGVGFLQQSKFDPVEDVGNPTVCFEVPTDGTKPTDHTLVENVGYLNYVLKNQPYWSSQSRTDVDAAVFGVHADQYVISYKQYYNDVLIAADCSFSGVSQSLQYAEQFCQVNDAVLSRYSTSTKTEDLNKGMNAPWSTDEAKGMKLSAFRENRGLPPYDFSVYVLNEKTIANAQDYSVVDNGDGTYSMSLTLNTNTGDNETSADYYYRIQMQANGGLNEKPTIYTTTLIYTFDASWRVLKLEVEDSYTAKAMGMNTNCASHTVTNYYYEEESAKNTFWEDYFKDEYERVKNDLSDGSDIDKEETPSAMGYLANAFGSVLAEGAIFKVDLNIDNLDLNGVVCVEMTDGLGLTAKLGDILVWLDGNTLYINDGASNYKLNTSGLLASDEESEEEGDLPGGFDLTSLMDQMTAGEFVVNEETGVATLNCEVELFGLKIPMEFEFQKTENGEVELNFLKAEISLGGKVVKAKLCFGTESDKPAIPEDTSAYQDILNDGITFGISLNANGFTLDGTAKIIMQNGTFAGVYADLGDITVYYDYPHNMLYLSKGDLKYKLNLSTLNAGNANTLALPDSLDINSILSDVLNSLYTTENSLGSTLDINIDALKIALSAALDIRLFGGLKVNADLTLNTLNLSLSASLSNTEVTLPDVTDYKDILNSDIALDVSLTLLTGTEDAAGKRDEVILEGKVALHLADNTVAEIRADFGWLAVYFDVAAKSIYVKVGENKVMINLAEMDLTNLSLLSALDGGDPVAADLPDAIKELLTNLVGDGKIITTNANLSILNAVVPVWAELDLSKGISVRAGLSLLGIDAVAKVEVSETALEGLSGEEKEEYVDVLKEGHKIVESLIGNHISATVEGTLYSYEEKYAELDNVKYTFTAAVEYDGGEISVDEAGVEVDSKAYIHLNIGLTAKHTADNSLYLDVILMDANPATGADGKTTGGYTQDGKFDVYLSVSNRLNNPVPLQIYAPVDEILSLVAMVGATVNLDGITVENSQELTAAIAQISGLLDGMLISKCLPKSVQDKFASLGDSLIPQILGVSLEELLNNLFGNVDNTVKEVEKTNFLLSDKYVSSIRTTDESLIFVLNSSLIYNEEIDSKDNLTVTFDRVLKNGIYFVGGASLENIFFGENRSNKLNLGLTLGYDEVTRPNASTGFKGYLNADGLDDLLNGLVNSATHSKDIATDREKEVYGADITDYILNHYYYLNGQLTAKLNVIDIVKVNIVLDLVGVSVTIDEETNEVAFNVCLHYNALTARAASADYIVINGESYVDLTLKNGMLYIKRTQLNYLEEGGVWATIVGSAASAAGYDLTPAKSSKPKEYTTPIVTYRVYDFKNMGNGMNDIMDLVSYVLNLDHRIAYIITDSISKSDGSSYVKTDTNNFDYGDWQNYYLKTYVYTEDDKGNASWKFTLNGKFLSDIMGMEVKDPVITFNATYMVDEGGRKSFIVNNLDITDITFNFVKVGSGYISMSASGTVNYLNPQLVMREGCTDKTDDSSLLWEQVFECSSKEISSTNLWSMALELNGKNYLSIDASDASAPLKLGELKFTLSGEPVENSKLVLYTDEEILSDFVVPAYSQINGYSIKTVLDIPTLTVNSSYVANEYNVTMDFGELTVPDDVIGYVYGEDLNLSEYFGKTYADEDGKTWKIVGFTLDGTTYDEGNPVISSSALSEIYCKDFVLNVTSEEMENDTATHVTLNSTVDFSYTGYAGTYKLLNMDLEDGASYALADATAGGYTFLGWWYNDNGDWRKVTSVEEFAVEGAASFVTLEALWVKTGVTGSATTAKGGFLNSEIHYTVSADAAYEFAGSEAILANLSVKSVQYTWNSYSWTQWNERGNHSTEDCSNLSYTFDMVKSNGANKFEKWRVKVVFTIGLPDGTSTTVSAEQEGSFN